MAENMTSRGHMISCVIKVLRNAAMLAVVLIITVQGVCAAEPVKAGKVVTASGDVRVRRDAENGTDKLSTGSIVHVGDTVVTGRAAKVKLLMKDESVITIGSNSTINIKEYYVEHGLDERKTVVNLLTGKFRAFVDKSFSSRVSSFEVQTPTAVAGVKGTHFVVVSNLNDDTAVYCLEGEVEARNRNLNIKGNITLGKGECAEVQVEQAPSYAADCIKGNELYDILNETTIGELELGAESVMIGYAEMEDNQSFTVQDLQEILSVEGGRQPDYGYGEVYIGEEPDGSQFLDNDSPLLNIPHGGTGGGGRDVSPNGN